MFTFGDGLFLISDRTQNNQRAVQKDMKSFSCTLQIHHDGKTLGWQKVL